MKHLKKALALILSVAMVFTSFSYDVSAATLSATPSGGTVSGCPFVYGTGGSNSFRIPAMVTLSDGTLVAAADARWNTTYDGGCGDTIVARSSDNGSNWSYTFANYLGDNGNTYDGSGSTCFIDPALAVDSNDKIYMLVDLYPYGVAINGSGNTAPSTASGFNSDGTLKLSTDGSDYNYYLKDGKIYDSSNTEVTGYTVDAKFNVYQNGTYVSNLFFSDSPYKVVRTGYLYLTTSTDKGATWSEPTLLPNIKTTSEQVCLVGPGRGNVLSDGTIVFPVYSYNGSNDSQYVGFIYSTNNGSTWSRSNSSISSWSSESAIVEVNSSTLRVFYRNSSKKICYVDVTKNGNSYTWGSAVTTSVACNSNTQLSAIKVTSGGTDYILVSCPGNPSSDSSASARTNGQIVTFKASDMSTVKTTSVPSVHTSNSFMYSCMSQLKSGSVAILYEDQQNDWGYGSSCYYQMSFKTFSLSDLGITTSSTDQGSETPGETVTSTENVTLKVGESKDFTVDTTTISTQPDSGIATASIEAAQADGYTAVTSITSGKKYLLAVNTSHVLTTASNSNSWSINGYTTTSASVSSGVISGTSYDTYLWTITKSESGYTLQNASGQYLAVDEANPDVKSYGTNYPLTILDTPYYFTIDATNGSVGSVNKSGVYLNNFGGANTCIAAYTGASTITFYEQNSADSTLTITGVSAGTTSVTVGSTKFNVTVNPKEFAESKTVVTGKSITLNPTVPNGGSVTYAVTSNASLITLNGATVTAGSTTGKATVVATVKASNGNTYATYTYTINVSDVTTVSADLTVVQRSESEISVTLGEGQTVEWTSADASIASVGAEYSGTTATGNAMVMGNAAGSTTITGTVKNSDGSTAAIYTWNTTVTAASDSNTSTRHIYVKVKQITNCTVYYSINGGELLELAQPDSNGYVMIDSDITGHFNIMFFAAPDDECALTYMGVSGSDNQYYTLSNGNPDGTGSDAWPMSSDTATQSDVSTSGSASCYKSGHGFRWPIAEGNMTLNRMKAMFSQAIALGCDGVTSFTKNATEDYYCEVQFVAQPLPKLTKTIKSITHNGTTKTYSAGDIIELGDTITYTVTVTEPAYLTGDVYTASSYTSTKAITSSNKPSYTTGSLGTITYSSVALKDELTGNNGISTPNLGTSTADEQTFSYVTSVTLTMSNFDKVVNGVLTNTATLAYDYKSSYSIGTINEKADAVAEVEVKVPEYVIDFGSPVTIDLGSTTLGSTTISEGTANYGSVAVSGTSFTYTPNTVLLDKDYVSLTLGNGTYYGVNIYPATTVYYDETFATIINGGFSAGTKDITVQAAQELGSSTDEYGYDSSIAGEKLSSGVITSSATQAKAEFSFVGTGIDVYAYCTADSGSAYVKLYKDGSLVKMASVNTTSSSTIYSCNGTKEYGLPIFSVTGMEYGNYKIQVYTTTTAGVNIDGFRVYETMETEPAEYKKDKEDSPLFYELRNELLFGDVDGTDIAQSGDSGEEDDYVQVLAGTLDGTVNAVSLTKTVTENNETTNVSVVSETEVNEGPKNEIFMEPGTTLTFKVATDRNIQIGLKAVNAAASCKLNGTSISLNNAIDMFYLVENQVTDSDDNQIITIYNDSENVISVTKMKVCDDPDASFVPLTDDDLQDAFVALGLVEEPEEPVVEYADATCSVNLVDYTGAVLASTSLNSNGVAGENATFAAADIQAAAEAVLPSGYAFADASAIADASIVYGEDGAVSVQIGKVATLKITFKKGRTVVGTATLTQVQTSSSSKYTFSTSEIKAAAPAGCRVMSLRGTSVRYGSTTSMSVTCR